MNVLISMSSSSSAKRAPSTIATNCKRYRINDFSRNSYASKSAISSILKDVRDNGIPKAISRASQYRAKKGAINVETDYGPLHKNITIPLSLDEKNPKREETIPCQKSNGDLE